MSKTSETAFTITTTATNRKDELNPELRLQQLESNAATAPMDNRMSIMWYYDASMDMIKKADRQYANNELESAFLSYLRFLDLFRNKIRGHVRFKHVPLSAKACNQYYQRHADQRAKELRATLLQRFRDMAALHQGLEAADDDESLALELVHRQSSKLASKTRTMSTSTIDPIDRTAFEAEGCRLLRTVVVPRQLPTVFQIVTQKARSERFSAWGTLMGRPERGQYVVTHLVIPCQEERDRDEVCGGSSRRYARKHRLLVLGWIHSHRPASCYMSSADLHVQREFQRVLPEAVCIVCAPRFTQVEFYILLKFGMEYIGQCDKVGTHSHDADKPLYSIARHVKVVYDKKFQLVDLLQGEEGNIH